MDLVEWSEANRAKQGMRKFPLTDEVVCITFYVEWLHTCHEAKKKLCTIYSSLRVSHGPQRTELHLLWHV